MTERYHTLTVVLDHDMRLEEVDLLVQAIRQLRGITSVSANVADYTSFMAEERAKRTLRERLWKILQGHPC
jgi:hypothetical protein